MNMGLYVLIAILLVVIVFILMGVRVINQGYVGLVERPGKFHRTLPPGLHIIIPFFDRIARTPDMRTIVLNSDEQSVITKDNVGFTVDTVAYFRIIDPYKAIYEVNNLRMAIESIIATTLRNEFGQLDLDETLTSRDKINHSLRETLDSVTTPWGVRIERVEVKNIDPPAEIREAMEKQMHAERVRREKVTHAEGEKTAVILKADGLKQSIILEAEADKQKQILEAEAQKQYQILLAEGEKQAIELVAQAEANRYELIYSKLKSLDVDSSILQIEGINAFKELGKSENKMIVPYEAAALMGALKSGKEMLKGQ